MQYENKSPVYTRDSHRVNTFARLESALRSVWLRSEAPSMEHFPKSKSLQLTAQSGIKSASQSCGLMGFQKYVMRGVYVHMQQVATADVHRATGNVESGALVSQPLLVFKVQHFIPNE